MGHARDILEDAGALLAVVFAIKVLSGWRREPWWTPEYTDKGGRGAGPGSTSQPVPQGAAQVWSEPTMRLFDAHMRSAGVDPFVVLLGIAAASNFNADEYLGNNTGLLLVQRQDLEAVGYPPAPPFEELDAPGQIPWLGRVIAYRMADRGGAAPGDVPSLALLLHPANPPISEVIRNEAARRAADSEGTMLYINHANLLRHVRANP